ncbi:putative motility protein [Brevibacillus daliensis]|uniref:putative motility protein n=1 Tax=Brevibacillus daliensis TaxID=2892995 RepID=UPI001E55EC8F|nr:putative motility protein [Brevibacillus daliensis]
MNPIQLKQAISIQLTKITKDYVTDTVAYMFSDFAKAQPPAPHPTSGQKLDVRA